MRSKESLCSEESVRGEGPVRGKESLRSEEPLCGKEAMIASTTLRRKAGGAEASAVVRPGCPAWRMR